MDMVIIINIMDFVSQNIYVLNVIWNDAID